MSRGFQQNPFTVEPFTESSRLIWERRQHVVLGVSPGNSYFRVSQITILLDWLCKEFNQVDVIIPDSTLVHTYQALGYDPQRALKKARSEINVLSNRVARAWKSSGGPRPVDSLHRMSDLETGTVYQQKLAESEQALKEDAILLQTCVEMSRDVLASRGHQGPLTAGQIKQSMRYLIAELPFFLASSDIFGVRSSLNFYHRELPLAELIFAGKSRLRVSSRQGYALIRPAQ
jgi:cyclo(L-tyrosyl-L-tyrosyl) synthase